MGTPCGKASFDGFQNKVDLVLSGDLQPPEYLWIRESGRQALEVDHIGQKIRKEVALLSSLWNTASGKRCLKCTMSRWVIWLSSGQEVDQRSSRWRRGMEGKEFFLCHVVIALTSAFQISRCGGKILFCKEPVAMESNEGSLN